MKACSRPLMPTGVPGGKPCARERAPARQGSAVPTSPVTSIAELPSGVLASAQPGPRPAGCPSRARIGARGRERERRWRVPRPSAGRGRPGSGPSRSRRRRRAASAPLRSRRRRSVSTAHRHRHDGRRRPRRIGVLGRAGVERAQSRGLLRLAIGGGRARRARPRRCDAGFSSVVHRCEILLRPGLDEALGGVLLRRGLRAGRCPGDERDRGDDRQGKSAGDETATALVLGRWEIHRAEKVMAGGGGLTISISAGWFDLRP